MQEPKTREILHCLFAFSFLYPNRSGVVDLVGREPLIIARVENGVTKFSPQRQKTPKNSKTNFGSGKQFSVGNFHIQVMQNGPKM